MARGACFVTASFLQPGLPLTAAPDTGTHKLRPLPVTLDSDALLRYGAGWCNQPRVSKSADVS
eukprot:364346-Chlamydomonas_euryale.AAC.2